MKIAHIGRAAHVVAALLALVVASSAGAQERRQSVSVGGVTVHYGFLPAEVAGEHTAPHEVEPMHGRARKGDYHLIVALYDPAGERISDAEVRATVRELGLAGTRKALERMVVNETLTFGNFFPMRSGGHYRVTLEIRLRGAERPLEAQFEYRHR